MHRRLALTATALLLQVSGTTGVKALDRLESPPAANVVVFHTLDLGVFEYSGTGQNNSLTLAERLKSLGLRTVFGPVRKDPRSPVLKEDRQWEQAFFNG